MNWKRLESLIEQSSAKELLLEDDRMVLEMPDIDAEAHFVKEPSETKAVIKVQGVANTASHVEVHEGDETYEIPLHEALGLDCVGLGLDELRG